MSNITSMIVISVRHLTSKSDFLVNKRYETKPKLDENDYSTIPDFLLAPRERSRSRSRSRGSMKGSRIRKLHHNDAESDFSLKNSDIMEKNGHYFYDRRNKKIKDIERMSVRSGTRNEKKDKQGNLDKWSKSYVQKSKNNNPKNRKLRTSGTIKKIIEGEDLQPFPSEFELRRKQDSNPRLDELYENVMDHNGKWVHKFKESPINEKIFKKKKVPRVDIEDHRYEQPQIEKTPKIEKLKNYKPENQDLKEMILNITEHSRSSEEHESETMNKVSYGIFRETMESVGDEDLQSEKETTKINNGSGGLSYKELSELVESLREENAVLKAKEEDYVKESQLNKTQREEIVSRKNEIEKQLEDSQIKNEFLQNKINDLEDYSKKNNTDDQMETLTKKIKELEDDLENEKSRYTYYLLYILTNRKE